MYDNAIWLLRSSNVVCGTLSSCSPAKSSSERPHNREVCTAYEFPLLRDRDGETHRLLVVAHVQVDFTVAIVLGQNTA